MMSELNIKSRDTFYRHRNQLIKHGYLTIEKIRKEGKFQNNIYYIEAIPEVKEEKEEKQPYPKNQTTARCPKKSTTEKSTTKNKDTNINRSYQYQVKEVKQEKRPNPKNQTNATCSKKSTTEKPTTKNKDTNINRS